MRGLIGWSSDPLCATVYPFQSPGRDYVGNNDHHHDDRKQGIVHHTQYLADAYPARVGDEEVRGESLKEIAETNLDRLN